MKKQFNRLFIGTTLGEIFIHKLIPTKWLSEFSQKLHFRPSYWFQAWHYGQTQTVSDQANYSKLPVSMNYNQQIVSQDQYTGQNAELKTPNEILRKSGINESSKISRFAETVNFYGLKVRVFNGLYTFWSNKRLRWGMIMLLIIAPISKYLYLIFPANGIGDYFINVGPIQILNTIETPIPVKGVQFWYFLTLKEYFWSIGELLSPTISVVGIFLLFPRKYYPSYLVGVPFGYYLSALLHRMFFVDSYQSFHGGVATSIVLMFALLGVVFFIISDKVLFKQNHVKRAAEARIIGLINMPGLDWQDKEPMIKKEVAEVMKVDNELFIKETG